MKNSQKFVLIFISAAIAVFMLFSCGTSPSNAEVDAIKDSVTTQADELMALNTQIRANSQDAALYHKRAEYYSKVGNFKESMEDIDRALIIDSTNATFNLFKADLFFSKAKVVDSKKVLDKLLSYEENADAYFKLAEIYLLVENYKEALIQVNKGLKIDENRAKGYFIKGLVYKNTGDTALAVSSMQTCVEQNPEYYDAYIYLGLFYAQIKNPLALAYYDNAIRLYPQSEEAWYNKAVFLQEVKDSRRSLDAYNTIISFMPKSEKAWYNKGYIYLTQLQVFDSAVYCFDQAAAITPKNYQTFYNRGLSYEYLKEDKKAELDYRKALDIQPDYTLAAKGISRVVDKDYRE